MMELCRIPVLRQRLRDIRDNVVCYIDARGVKDLDKALHAR